jgi:hypothetical protein
MRILLIDHGCCDHPHTRIHRLREALVAAGASVAVCGPSSLHGLDEQPTGMHGIHLNDIAAANHPDIRRIKFNHVQSAVAADDAPAATPWQVCSPATAGGFTAVGKRLLWQGFFLSDNFEGMTLGPRLNNGAYSVVLISDNGSGGSGQRQDLYSLVLRGVGDPADTPGAATISV